MSFFIGSDDENPIDELVYRVPPRPRERAVFTTQRKILVPLEWKDERWRAEVDCYFRPMGLMVVNAPRRGGVVAEWLDGNDNFLGKPVSLDVFTFIETLDANAPCRPTHTTLSPGLAMSLRVVDVDGLPYGPPLELVVWGQASRNI